MHVSVCLCCGLKNTAGMVTPGGVCIVPRSRPTAKVYMHSSLLKLIVKVLVEHGGADSTVQLAPLVKCMPS